jgi:hypothetical protein
MDGWQIRISDSFDDFKIKIKISQLQKNGSNFIRNESGRSLTK